MYICDFSRSDGAGSADDPEHARADALGDRLDRAALAGAVASLEHDDDAQALVLDPVLQVAQLDLQLAQLLLVFLALQAGVPVGSAGAVAGAVAGSAGGRRCLRLRASSSSCACLWPWRQDFTFTVRLFRRTGSLE